LGAVEKMVRIVFSPLAIDDLTDIADYIAKDSMIYAKQFVRRIRILIQNLTRFPRIGRIVPEKNIATIRELLFKEYRIIYRLSSTNIEIVRIFHGSRNFPTNI
jgi:plasmid stabilization system protein ParE